MSHGDDMLIRPSIGVARALPTQPDLDPDTLMKRADIAMYAAKRSRVAQVNTRRQVPLTSDPTNSRKTVSG